MKSPQNIKQNTFKRMEWISIKKQINHKIISPLANINNDTSNYM